MLSEEVLGIIFLFSCIMDSNIASRLKTFMESTGLNNSQFADTCGIPKPSLSQILSGRNKKVSNQLLELIHTAFPDLNIIWLVFGEGEMKLSDRNLSAHSSDINLNESGEVRSEPTAEYGSPRSEISFSTSEGSVLGKESNHNDLTRPYNGGQLSADKQVESSFQIQELQMQIENLRGQIEKIRQNPRKVASITVYYDDSTFETFLPG